MVVRLVRSAVAAHDRLRSTSALVGLPKDGRSSADPPLPRCHPARRRAALCPASGRRSAHPGRKSVFGSQLSEISRRGVSVRRRGRDDRAGSVAVSSPWSSCATRPTCWASTTRPGPP
ncbi:hypothetical protein QJS66_05845 [Kocuria rhizophila]|nr:hypothetical protein QJS66_05845 [Kocuria rhizophila]